VLVDGNTLQCCLVERKDRRGFKKEIKRADTGVDDGICGDVNAKLIEKMGLPTCEEILFVMARLDGYRII
jgi:hypothetical protein